ncbi:Receptor-type tyrosine-protein phosphatase N2 [Pteropus alecto]|uniref:Receptor-type tyrosine-protein phosphatase N2 n=1 Tax=Pteropus alecto TaxID=9402 RepID=L5L7M3_PTEAL|nr:Receptor-type tyrosine-protein phosphatase N2 [Pteropus alecto]
MLLGTCRRSWLTLREGPPGAGTRGQAAASADGSEQAFEGGLLDARLAGPPPDGRILLRVIPGSMVTLAAYPLSQNSAAEPSVFQRQRPRARAQLKVPYEAAIELSSQGSAPRHQKSKIKLLPHQAAQEDSTKFVVLTLVSIAAIVGVLLASGAVYCLRHSSRSRLKEKLSGLGDPGPDATAAYQVKRLLPYVLL